MEEWQLLEVGSQAEHVQFDSSDEDVESQGRKSDFKGSTSSGHQTPPDPYMTCMTCMTFIWSPGKQQVEVFVQNSEWAAMDSSLALQPSTDSQNHKMKQLWSSGNFDVYV